MSNTRKGLRKWNTGSFHLPLGEENYMSVPMEDLHRVDPQAWIAQTDLVEFIQQCMASSVEATKEAK